MPEISSRSNPRVKLVRALHRRKTRQEEGLFLVEGLRHLGELVDSKFETEFLLCTQERFASPFALKLKEQFQLRGTPIFDVPPDLMDQLSERSRSGGLLAVVRQREAALHDLTGLSDQTPTVALVAPQDPGNIGTILRSMNAFQAGALVLIDGGADSWHPTAVRASMGAIFRHPVVVTDFQTFKTWVAENHQTVYATSARGTTPLQKLEDLPRTDVFLFGSERQGLRPEHLAICKQILSIPMSGSGTSLNLATAAGIVLYTAQLFYNTPREPR